MTIMCAVLLGENWKNCSIALGLKSLNERRSPDQGTKIGDSPAIQDSYGWVLFKQGRIAEALPGIRDLAVHFEGVDPVHEPVPIVPALVPVTM